MDEVEAELDWIEQLAGRGIPVCRAQRSLAGRRCEVVDVDGVAHLVVRFDKAAGRPVEMADFGPELDASLGKLTARLHAASFDDPTTRDSVPLPVRAPWHRSRLLNDDLERFTPPEVKPFRAAVRALVEGLIPRVERRLGLLHADISFSNVFLDDGGLVLFDFDNCENGPIEQDFATVLYDSVYCRLLHRVPQGDLAGRIAARWDGFLAGYRGIRPHVAIDTDLLRNFLVLREAVIYTHYCRTLDLSAVRPGFREGMDEMRRNVEAGITPVVGIV